MLYLNILVLVLDVVMLCVFVMLMLKNKKDGKEYWKDLLISILLVSDILNTINSLL